MPFKKIDPKLNLPAEEEKILSFWRENDIFQKSLKKPAPKGNFVFYEGPPTANGQPGIHHVLARAFKDLFARYKTMQGFHVARKAGWDTHGLPVELQVEKELGISGKQQIENIVVGDKRASIEKFNQLCRESVWQYKADWEKMTERMAYWVDMSDPYITSDPKYIETLWWIISEVDKKGLLYKGHKIVPYCPRCGTGLSSHEVAQGYKLTKEDSIYIRLKSTKEDVYFLVWTTTPWTLAGNAALAVNPSVKYVRARIQNSESRIQEDLILAKNRAEQVLIGLDYKIVEEFEGHDLVDSFSFTNDQPDYEPIYPDGEKFSEAGDKVYKLINADFVSDADGTGIVHVAPAFGADDYVFGHQNNDIKVLKTIDDKGTELAGAGTGLFVKDADKEVKQDLTERGILFKTEPIEHDYPFCWRCESPLLYVARDSWYIAMSKLRDQLLNNNSKIKWNPSHLRDGRFGNWLENVNDWALSRDRYWGTPLPVWVCDKCDKYRVVSSLAEVNNVEPHKPFIDEVTFDCECGGLMTRTPEVMDVWLDSGAMPFAQYHYPFENKELFDGQFPADFICEAVDQTRGWFYTLLAVSTVLKDESSFKSVISTGHVLDQFGKKMSKSKGNIVTPDEAFQKYGADVIRYFFFAVNQPGEPKLYNEKEVVSISRNLFMTLWNVSSFFMMYASIDNWSPSNETMKQSNNVLDLWILAKFQELVNGVNKDMDDLDPYQSSNLIISFVNELSTWYVRRSRRRFWKSESDSDKESAYSTLYYILMELSKLLAPFTPMFAEVLYQGLHQDNESESVHLCDYPKTAEYDKVILDDMTTTRKVVEEGLSKRAEAKIKIRQPLSSLSYSGSLEKAYEDIIAEEVNVKEVNHKANGDTELNLLISEELKIEGIGREMIRNMQSLRKESGFQVEDHIKVTYDTDSDILKQAMTKMSIVIAKEVLANEIHLGHQETEGEAEFDLEGEKIWVGLTRNK